MKVAVIAANGKAGQLITKEAVDRGHDVTAIVRGKNKSASSKAIEGKDILSLVKADLAGFDVVIDAFGAWTPETLGDHVKTSQHLADLPSGTDTRLLIVGGAGSLYVDPEHSVQLVDTPDFPAEFVPLASAQRDELTEIRKRDDVRWTFVSPAADFVADGSRTGEYILAGEELTTNAAGASSISYADYAIAMVDEAERTGSDAHVGERISVLGK